MIYMANLTLIYGLAPTQGEVTEIHDATLKLANGHEAQVTMHSIEGSRQEIERQSSAAWTRFSSFIRRFNYRERRNCWRQATPASC